MRKDEKRRMKKIGIIGAMELEVSLLKERMEEYTVSSRAGMEFYEGKLRGMPTVVVKSGIGKVNAAICAQILADLFQVDAIVNTGIAGSLDAGIDIGDFVVSEDAMYHDMDVTLFGYAPGEVPGVGSASFRADGQLAQLVKEAHKSLGLDQKLFFGRIVSGDQFIESKEKKDWIVRTFQGRCTEMEGAAIAHAAYLNGIPYVILRAISDKADESATEDYPAFERRAAQDSAQLLCEMLRLYAQQETGK